MQKKLNTKGFTLIELIVVIAILGILVLLAAPKYLDYVQETKISQIKADTRVVENLVDAYLVKHGELPKEWDEAEQDFIIEALEDNRVYDKNGQVDELKPGDYYIVGQGMKEESKTKLEGDFIANNVGGVYYVHNEAIGGKEKDTEPPVLTLTLSTEDPTNGDIVITAIATDNDGVAKIILPDGSEVLDSEATYVVSENGEYEFKAVDEAGNETIQTISINNIDKDAPILTLTPSTTEPINGDVVITVSVTDGSGVEKIILPDGSEVFGDEAIYTVSENGDYEFKAIDKIGNEAVQTISINNIDKDAPILTLTPSTTEPINGDVVITITATDNVGIKKIILPDGSEVLGDEVTYTVSSNGEYEFKAVDEAGNEVAEVISVTNIDQHAGLRAPDEDFEFVKDSWAPNQYIDPADGTLKGGYFKYVGTDDAVAVPHTLYDNELKDYYYMFSNTSVSKVVSDNPNITNMSYMFYNSQATSLDLSSFDTSNVTNMGRMFRNSQATSLDLSSFDTSNVTTMEYMFYDSQATSLDLSSFNTSKVTTMSFMFSGSQATSLNLSSFNTSNVTNMRFMFYGSQTTSLDLSSFDTSNVTTMERMFYGSQATSLNLSSFNTSNVTNMGRMFYNSQATSLDLSSFNTSNVTDMSWMFNNSQATSLDLSSFDTSNVTNMSFMFSSSQATKGYAKTQADADRFNAISGKPSGLTFVVK